VTSGWPSKPLGTICEFSNGLWTGKKPPYEKAIVVRNTNFREHGRLDHSDVALLDVETKQLAKRRLQFGDIIIEKSGGGPKQPVGRVAYFDKADGVYSFSNFTSVARVINQSEVCPAYLLKFLDWCYISGVTEGMQSNSTGIRNLDFSAYKAIEVPVPPLEEQRRIVAVLHEAFAAIATATANVEKNLANARELSRFALISKTQSLSEGQRKLEDICIVDWGNTDLTKSCYVEDGPYLAVSAAGCDGRIGHAEHQGGVPVLSAIGARCGRMFFPEEPFTAIKNTITLTPLVNEVSGKFLFYLLESVELPKRGAAQPFIAKGDINKFQVPLPSMSNQLKLVREMDSIFAECIDLENTAQGRLQLLQELKQSLLQRAFTGELATAAPDLIPA
jgi:type I restriction enzyme S subunit